MLLTRLYVSALLVTVAVAQTEDFVGHVTNEAGEPLFGAALVSIHLNDDRPDALQGTELARTDAEGCFRLKRSAFRIGLFQEVLLVRAPQHQAEFILIETPQLATGDLGTIRLRRGRIVPLFIRDQEGKPIEGATVGIRGSDAYWTPMFDACRTDDRGMARFDTAPQGPLSCRVTAPGYFSREVRCATEPILIDLQPSGFVTGKVLGPTGNPLRAHVQAIWRHPNMMRVAFPMRYEYAEKTVDGKFRIPIEERELFRVTGTSIVGSKLLTFRSDELTGPETALELVAEEPSTHVRVLGDGEPLDTATTRVGFLPSFWSDEIDSSMFESAAAWTLRGDEISIGKPLADDLHVCVEVRAEGFVTERRRIDIDKTTTLDLRRAASIEGTVTDADGKPLAHAIIDLESVEPAFAGLERGSAFSDARGHFHMTGIAPGEQSIVVRCNGHQTKHASFTFTAGETLEGQSIELEPASAIRGRLLGVSTQSRWHALVANSSATSEAVFSMGVGIEPDGTFPLPFGLAKDQHIVVSVGQSNLLGVYDLSPGNAKERGDELHFDIPPFATLQGMIRAPGISLERLTVGLQPTDPNHLQPGARTPVSTRGTFSAPVVPGEYRITVFDRASGLPVHESKSIEFESDQTVETVLELEVARVTLRLGRQSEVSLADTLQIERPEPNWFYTPPIDLGTCPEAIELILPLGEVRFCARETDHTGMPNVANEIVSTLVIEVAGAKLEHTIELPGP